MILRMAPHLNDNQMQDLSDRTLIVGNSRQCPTPVHSRDKVSHYIIARFYSVRLTQILLGIASKICPSSKSLLGHSPFILQQRE